MGVRQTGVPLGAALAAAFLPQIASRVGPASVFPLLAPELLLLGIFFAALIRPIRRSPHERSQASQASLLPLILPASVGFLLVAGQYDLLAFTIDHLTKSGFPLWIAALSLTSAQLGGAVGRIGFGLISDHIGSRPKAIALSAALGAAGVVVTALLPRETPLASLLLLFFLTGAGAVGWNALVLTWGAERVAPERSGTAIGLLGSAIFLGSATFPPLFGLAVDSMHSYHGAFVMLGAQLALAGLIAWLSARRSVPVPV
ncbi:Major facilitator superfamily MFS-1, partial [mine drainage metagenome]